MFLYGVMPTGGAIFAVAMIHAVCDGITVSSTGVAVGLTVPIERQAGAQGVLGAAQAVSAGAMAVLTGALYEAFGRTAGVLDVRGRHADDGRLRIVDGPCRVVAPATVGDRAAGRHPRDLALMRVTLH